MSAGGGHTCGLRETGTVECWGNDFYGQLASPAGTFTSVDAGAIHTCGVRDTGAVECWGEDEDGESTPPAGTFVSVSAGGSHTCGVRDTGAVECWGEDEDGESTPPAGTFVSVSAGSSHTCGVRDTGTVECWGGDVAGEASPPSGRFISVSAGEGHTCGVRDTGAVECWGQDSDGQSTPPPGTFTAVSAWHAHTCGVRDTGAVECWGDDEHGGSTPPAGTFVSVSAGYWHACGVRNTGAVACWGWDSFGQATIPVEGPVTVDSGSDSFFSRSAISGASGQGSGSNSGGSKESGEPIHAGNTGGASMWWSWTAPATGMVTFDTEGSDFDTLLAVYTGGSVGALSLVASDDDTIGRQSEVSFTAQQGVAYHIAVDGYGGATGSILLNWQQGTSVDPGTEDPVTVDSGSDSFFSRSAISGASGQGSGSNSGGSKESGEPIHAGNTGGASMWWSWTAPATGMVTFDTEGSDFDTLLAVYTGGSVGALSLVASDDDTIGRQSEVSFTAQQGVAYHIAVDGYGGATGSILLNWQPGNWLLTPVRTCDPVTVALRPSDSYLC